MITTHRINSITTSQQMVAGLQHFLAVIGGILAAPLIMAQAMNLSVDDTQYIVSAALILSGVATLIQILRIGFIGSGVLSIQGTSFVFIAPVIYLYQQLPNDSTALLGLIFGCCAVCAVIIFILSLSLPLGWISANMTSTVLLLIGITLVNTTLQNLINLSTDNTGFKYNGLLIGLTLLMVAGLALNRRPWCRLLSISAGLVIGSVVAYALGYSITLSSTSGWFLPEYRYPFAIELSVVLLLLPVFVISSIESTGDLTATMKLSGLPVQGPAYEKRLRGGLSADALNSLLASVFSTFPNTTFSQNNGVIQLTGITQPRAGVYAAVLLIVAGILPMVSQWAQHIPPAVLYSATLLMFSMVILAGCKIFLHQTPGLRDGLIVVASISLALLLAYTADLIPSDRLRLLAGFPVATGAVLVLILDLSLPKAFVLVE